MRQRRYAKLKSAQVPNTWNWKLECRQIFMRGLYTKSLDQCKLQVVGLPQPWLGFSSVFSSKKVFAGLREKKLHLVEYFK